jgi:aryl-alcohol dehydrogenase-like predicted oxidoreductase
MEYTTLPNTDIEVSRLCLGSMTWGQQNTEKEGHEQIEYSLGHGINFIDTAEMYSIPGKAKTQGSTETILGNWIQRTRRRDDIILASKITGPNRYFEHIRDPLDFSKESIDDALNKSLSRLKTDYLDLYQLHWPERKVNVFGVRDYDHRWNLKWEDNLGEILDRLEQFVKEGKIRYIGLSNETPFGVMRYMEEHRKGKLKMVSVQNAYSLLQRRDEVGLTEVLHMENVGYLPYSPLGFGVLSGKYLNGMRPYNARMTLFPSYRRYGGSSCMEATEVYNELALKYGLSLSQMALAFVRQQDFVTSTIIGATTMDQLSENIDSMNVTLSEEILSEINAIHERMPNPAA